MVYLLQIEELNALSDAQKGIVGFGIERRHPETISAVILELASGGNLRVTAVGEAFGEKFECFRIHVGRQARTKMRSPYSLDLGEPSISILVTHEYVEPAPNVDGLVGRNPIAHMSAKPSEGPLDAPSVLVARGILFSRGTIPVLAITTDAFPLALQISRSESEIEELLSKVAVMPLSMAVDPLTWIGASARIVH